MRSSATQPPSRRRRPSSKGITGPSVGQIASSSSRPPKTNKMYATNASSLATGRVHAHYPKITSSNNNNSNSTLTATGRPRAGTAALSGTIPGAVPRGWTLQNAAMMTVITTTVTTMENMVPEAVVATITNTVITTNTTTKNTVLADIGIDPLHRPQDRVRDLQHPPLLLLRLPQGLAHLPHHIRGRGPLLQQRESLALQSRRQNLAPQRRPLPSLLETRRSERRAAPRMLAKGRQKERGLGVRALFLDQVHPPLDHQGRHHHQLHLQNLSNNIIIIITMRINK